jgi:hypothetical protein
MRILCPTCGRPGYANAEKPLWHVRRHGLDVRHYHAKGRKIHHHIPLKEALILLAIAPAQKKNHEQPSPT